MRLCFKVDWDVLIALYKRILTRKVFNKLLNTRASYLFKLLEKRRGYVRRISKLGVIKLESDVAGVMDVVVRDGLYGARDALARCSQICLASIWRRIWWGLAHRGGWGGSGWG